MKKTISRYFIYTLFIAIPLAMYSCYPGGLEYYSDSDIVVTNYDEGFNFSANKLYFMADTIHYLSDDDVDRSNEAAILNLIETNMEDAGYTRLKDASIPDSVLVDSANVVLLVIVTSTEYSGGGWWGGCYPYYWGCGYYPGYPWYGGGYYSYSYSTGTLIMEMANEDGINEVEDIVPIVWDTKINGLLSTNKSNMTTRIQNTINQAFVQSPYLSN